jgi:hypothetical protein
MSALEFLIGLALVLLVLLDIFRTVLLPRPARHTFRVAPQIGWVITPFWNRVADLIRSPDGRQGWRGSLGPFLLVVTLLIWVGVLFVGFGLMLHALRDQVQPPPTLWDSIYYAASSFLTLGMPSSTADGIARIVTVASGLTGLAVVTVVVTFILTVQNEITRREVLVLRTEVSSGRPPIGLAILETYSRNDTVDQLAILFRDWEVWTADVLHSHRANPILTNFRSADEDGEWLAVFGATLDAAVIFVAMVDHDKFRPGVSAARLFIAIGKRMISDLAGLHKLHAERSALGEELAAQLRPLRVRLAQCGYPLSPDEQASLAEALMLFAEYRALLDRLCQHLSIKVAPLLVQANWTAADQVIAETRQTPAT